MVFIVFFWQTFSECGVVKSCTISKKRDKAGLISHLPLIFICIFVICIFSLSISFVISPSCFLSVWIFLSLSLSGKMLSMGYGFVQYKTPKAAQKAMRKLQVNDHLLLCHCCVYVLLLCTNIHVHLFSLLAFFFVLQHCTVDEHQLELKISERSQVSWGIFCVRNLHVLCRTGFHKPQALSLRACQAFWLWI